MAKRYPALQAVTFALLYLAGMTGIDYLQGETINFDLLKRHVFVGVMVAVAMYFIVFKRQAEQTDQES